MTNEFAQHEITERKPLLDDNGHLTEAGYAKSLILDYRRDDIKAASYRIKEWDYYCVTNKDYALALTVDDNSYMGLDSISLINLAEKWEITNSPMQFFTNGKKHLPETSVTGDIRSAGKGYYIAFKNDGNKRILTFKMDNFKDGKPIEGAVTLDCPETDSMVIATPFAEDDKAFYYNQKINCMPAEGKVLFDGREYVFNKNDSFAVLDWGRGVWTYKNTWYWGSASGTIGGIPFGFNIGYGFGDTSAASENMIFFAGKAHKISRLTFNIPKKDGKDDFLSPWTIVSDDMRFDMVFTPILDRASKTDVKLVCSDQHQVFGTYTGKVKLDDGSVLQVNDFTGFAEKVYNKW